jgi:hypothetical protein
MLNLTVQMTTRGKVGEQVIGHPADLPGKDQGR